MIDLSAPDGTSVPINNTFLQSIGTLLPNTHAILEATSDAAWEQAGVVYINGARQPQLLGNYHHATSLGLPFSAHTQHIQVAGWHKRSGPDGAELWKPSNGALFIPWRTTWNDSGGDLDFDDLKVDMFLLPSPRGHFPFYRVTERDEQVPAWDPAGFIAALANLKTLARRVPNANNKKAVESFADKVLSLIINRYQSAAGDSLQEPLSPEIALAAELNFIAQSYPDGELRTELLRQIQLLLGRPKSSKRRTK